MCIILILASEQEAVNNTKLLQNNMTYQKEQRKASMMGTEVEQRSEEQYLGWQSAILWHLEPYSAISCLEFYLW